MERFGKIPLAMKCGKALLGKYVLTEYMEVTIYLIHTLKPGPHLNARMQAVVGALVRSGHRCSLIT